MIVSFTGHREIDESVARTNIALLLDARRPSEAIVGGAAGADTLAAEVCWNRSVPYTVALPHRDYPAHYKLGDDRWKMTIMRAQGVYVVVTNKPWHFSANFKRNEYMVDNSDVLIAISTFDPNGEIPATGGTAHCVRYAHKVGRTIDWAKT